MTDWTARVLSEVDRAAATTVERLAQLVRVPSIGGTDAEHDIQADLARELHDVGLEVDHWRLPIAELTAAPDFPGAEVERAEAWGLVGRLPGRFSNGGSGSRGSSGAPSASISGSRWLM